MKRLAAIIFTLAVLTTSEVLACVGCRAPGAETLVNEPQTALAGIGFSWGVIIMLACAFSIVGAMVGFICKTIARLDASGPEQ